MVHADPRHPVFLTVTNVLNIIRQSSIYGIMAIGMTFVILTAAIDLSVGSILAIAGAIAAGSIKAAGIGCADRAPPWRSAWGAGS